MSPRFQRNLHIREEREKEKTEKKFKDAQESSVGVKALRAVWELFLSLRLQSAGIVQLIYDNRITVLLPFSTCSCEHGEHFITSDLLTVVVHGIVEIIVIGVFHVGVAHFSPATYYLSTIMFNESKTFRTKKKKSPETFEQ